MKGIGRRIPLALFTYNRPHHTAATLKALSVCKGREEFDYFFFSDAPRRPDDSDSVEAVRRLLRIQAPLFKAQIIEQSTNQGLARSIVGGVDRLCASHGWVVVLEDDLLVEPSFLRFMAEALVHYEHSSTVMQVAATTLAPPLVPTRDAFLLPVTSTWGWGTWQRAWKCFSWVPQGWPQTADDLDWLSVFQLGGAADYVAMLKDRLAGHNDSWGILWWYAVSRLRGKVVYPTRSLVQNIGFDGTGVHCGKDSLFQFPETSNVDYPISSTGGPIFPDDEAIVPAHYKLLQTVLSGSSNPSQAWRLRLENLLSSVKRRINHDTV